MSCVLPVHVYLFICLDLKGKVHPKMRTACGMKIWDPNHSDQFCELIHWKDPTKNDYSFINRTSDKVSKMKREKTRNWRFLSRLDAVWPDWVEANLSKNRLALSQSINSCFRSDAGFFYFYDYFCSQLYANTRHIQNSLKCDWVNNHGKVFCCTYKGDKLPLPAVCSTLGRIFSLQFCCLISIWCLCLQGGLPAEA